MLSVPVRADVVGFALAAKLTVPLPLPAPPAVIVSHDALLVAVHAHPAALTPTDPVDAAAPNAAEDEVSVGAQDPDLAKVFERALVVEPPGPMAVTRDS